MGCHYLNSLNYDPEQLPEACIEIDANIVGQCSILIKNAVILCFV